MDRVAIKSFCLVSYLAWSINIKLNKLIEVAIHYLPIEEKITTDAIN